MGLSRAAPLGATLRRRASYLQAYIGLDMRLTVKSVWRAFHALGPIGATLDLFWGAYNAKLTIQRNLAFISDSAGISVC